MRPSLSSVALEHLSNIVVAQHSLPQRHLPFPRFLEEAASPEAFLFSATTASVPGDDNSPFGALSSSSSVLLSGANLNTLIRPEAWLPPLNPASEDWIRGLVWTDFRVAVAFFVVVPLGLLAWAVAARMPFREGRSASAEPILRYMTSYWQASSLLLLTVALNIQENNLGVVTGLAAQAMIVVSLWWWQDLNEEIVAKDERTEDLLPRLFVLWRSVATISASVGVLVQAPFQTCSGGAVSLVQNPFCAPWLEPPRFAADLVGLKASEGLGNLALGGCGLYALVLAYYAIVLLPSVGRKGRAPRPALMDVATPIGAWQALGFLETPVPKQQ